jgi:hypothetical protein
MRWIMIDRLGVHRADDANFISYRADVWKKLIHPSATFAELLKPPLRPETLQRRTLQLRELLPLRERIRHWFSVHFRELRLPIECLQVRRPACHGKPNHALRLRHKMPRKHHAIPFRSSLCALASEQ